MDVSIFSKIFRYFFKCDHRSRVTDHWHRMIFLSGFDLIRRPKRSGTFTFTPKTYLFEIFVAGLLTENFNKWQLLISMLENHDFEIKNNILSTALTLVVCSSYKQTIKNVIKGLVRYKDFLQGFLNVRMGFKLKHNLHYIPLLFSNVLCERMWCLS